MDSLRLDLCENTTGGVLLDRLISYFLTLTSSLLKHEIINSESVSQDPN